MAYLYFPGGPSGAFPVQETVAEVLERIDDMSARTARGYITFTRKQHEGDDRPVHVLHTQITAVTPASFDNEEQDQ